MMEVAATLRHTSMWRRQIGKNLILNRGKA
jgi:hypothetical protein